MPLPRLQRYGQKRVQVVDTDEDIRLMLSDRLEAMGYAVFSATNGAQAMRILDLLALDGILLDREILMKNGLTMLEKIQQHIHVPVIIMSIDAHQQKLANGIEQGVIDYLLKPIDLVLLKQKCLRCFT